MGIGGFGSSSSKSTAPSSTTKKRGVGGFSSSGGSGGGKGIPGVAAVKNAGGDALSLVGKALNALDVPRASLLAEGRQVGRLVTGKPLSLDDMVRQIKEHQGVGALVENANLPMNVKRAIGLVGDVATDPLTYLTFGVGGATKEATLQGAKAVGEEGARKAVKITAEEAARELDQKGMREAANKVLARHSVNALSADEAAAIGVRQGPTVGAAGRRLAVPGGDTAARKVSDLLGPLTEKLHEVAPLRGRTSEAAKGLEPVAALRLKDAEQLSRLTAKGMADSHLAALRTVLKDGELDKDAVRAALEGTGSTNPTAQRLRSILDSIAARTEELTGRHVPRVEHYLPHRLTDEAKAVLNDGGRTGTRGTAAVMSRAYKAGDTFLGQVLEDGSIDELNRIAGDKGLGQLFKDDPIQLVHGYINEMKAFAARAGVPMRLSTDDVLTKAIGAPGSRAAKKAIKAMEAERAKLAGEPAVQAVKDSGLAALEGRGKTALSKADELEAQARGLHGEEVAYRLHAQMFSDEARPALATETRGQNAYLNYHPDNVARRVAGESVEFPPQKAALLDAEFHAISPTPNELADRAVRNNGFTVDPKTGAVPKEGFAVSVKGAEESFPPPASPEELAQRIQEYVSKHAADFADGEAHLGGWVDEKSGQLYLDVTRILPDRGAAEAFGREQGQLAFFDLAKGQEVRLPGEAASVGGSAGRVGGGAERVPVAAAQVSADHAAAAQQLRGRLEDVERKLKEVAKLDKPNVGAALKAGLDTRRAGLEAKKAAILDEVRALQAQVRNDGRLQVVAESHNFDHAVAATHTEAAAQQATDNLRKLEALRVATAERATQRQAAEMAAREQADALLSQAVALRAQGQDDLATVLSLQGMATKTEADLNKMDGELGKLRELASKKRMVVDAKAMANQGLYDLGNGRYAEPWVADALTRLDEALRPEKVGGLLKLFDRVSAHWRAAALLSPGFHERNFFGGLFNNHLAGMDTRRYFDFAVANRQFKRGLAAAGNVEGGLAAIEDKGVRDAMAAAVKLGQYEGADISDVSTLVGNGEGGRIIGNQNPLYRANVKAGRVVESNLRMPLFIDTFIKSGGNEKAALDTVMTYHFDYEDLSRFERVVTRRTFAFYTWTRKNLPLQLLNMADQPGSYTAYLHLKRNVELGTPEDAVVPSFFGRQLAIRLPFMADGGRVYAMPDLPFVNASEALGTESLLSSLNPLIKTPLEAVTNHKFFEQRSFKANLEQAPSTWVPILQVLRGFDGKFGLPKVYKANDGTLMMSEHEASKIESLVPLLSRLRRLAPSEKKYQDRALTSWLSFAFGISARTLDQSTIGGEVQRRAGVQSQQDALAAQLAGGQKLADYKLAQAAEKRRKAAATAGQ